MHHLVKGIIDHVKRDGKRATGETTRADGMLCGLHPGGKDSFPKRNGAFLLRKDPEMRRTNSDSTFPFLSVTTRSESGRSVLFPMSRNVARSAPIKRASATHRGASSNDNYRVRAKNEQDELATKTIIISTDDA